MPAQIYRLPVLGNLNRVTEAVRVTVTSSPIMIAIIRVRDSEARDKPGRPAGRLVEAEGLGLGLGCRPGRRLGLGSICRCDTVRKSLSHAVSSGHTGSPPSRAVTVSRLGSPSHMASAGPDRNTWASSESGPGARS